MTGKRKRRLHWVLALVCFHLCVSHSYYECENGGGEEEGSSLMKVFIGLKTTTAEDKYIRRTREILHSWGRDARGYMALITDGANKHHNVVFKREFPSLPIIEVEGTEKFGFYHKQTREKKNCTESKDDCVQEAFNAQRKKTRAFLEWFLDNSRNESGINWMCYIDDDMYVNVKRLNDVLEEIIAKPPRTCLDAARCVVADTGFFPLIKNLFYSTAVWCMQIPTAKNVRRLFDLYNDRELGWTDADDVGLAKVLHRHLNITYTDSKSMLSVLNKLVMEHRNSHSVLRKINVRHREEWARLKNKKISTDILTETSVLALQHVNYSDVCDRVGGPCNDNPNALVGMKEWNSLLNIRPPCRKNLQEVLKRPSAESYIERFKR